ncbi:cell division protein FtsQ, partial [Amylibacter sp.]|nr:cell division protein FtsQ [Amylibacter sp.]
MQSINRKEPQLRRISTIEAINKRKQEAPNIAPLGEISAEKIGRLFGQKSPEKIIKSDPAPSKIKYKINR